MSILRTEETPRARGGLDAAEPLSIEDAYDRVRESALTESAIGGIGLELESHVVDLDAAARPVGWARTEPLRDDVRVAARLSVVSREPGGQLELSGLPTNTVSSAVAGLRADLGRVRTVLAEHGLGLAPVGTDPVRPPRQVNPSPRYRAMARHFAAIGRAAPGTVTMNATAALQVNLDAGPRRGWTERVAHAHRLGPTLAAVSASSPWLCGRPTGWRSVRSRAWLALDRRRCRPVFDAASRASAPGATTDPATAWALFALRAPVMFVRIGGSLSAVRGAVTFEQWVTGDARPHGRPPTAEDLDLHLTTLFPPVRLRGYLELRYLDAVPDRWWPALVAVTTTLLDDPVAADLAAEATEGTETLWTEAARDGLTDTRLATSARRCLRIAADRAPADLATEVADLVELVASGRSPGDLLTERIRKVGLETAFAELARGPRTKHLMEDR